MRHCVVIMVKDRNSIWNCLKTLQEKQKMLVISIFSFSHNVFKKLLFQVRLRSGLCGKELNLGMTSSLSSFDQKTKVETAHLIYESRKLGKSDLEQSPITQHSINQIR